MNRQKLVLGASVLCGLAGVMGLTGSAPPGPYLAASIVLLVLAWANE